MYVCCMYICMHVLYSNVCVCVYIYIYICIYSCVHACMCVSMTRIMLICIPVRFRRKRLPVRRMRRLFPLPIDIRRHNRRRGGRRHLANSAVRRTALSSAEGQAPGVERAYHEPCGRPALSMKRTNTVKFLHVCKVFACIRLCVHVLVHVRSIHVETISRRPTFEWRALHLRLTWI